MYFHQDIKGCLKSAIGSEGLDEKFLEKHIPTLKKTVGLLKSLHAQEDFSFVNLPYSRSDLQKIRDLVLHIQDDFSDIVILGTGGSSLGGQTLCALSDNDTQRLHFMDNIDPETFARLFKKINLKSTFFIAISKSGKTVETLVQFLVCLQKMLEAAQEEPIKNHFLIITEPQSSPLRKLGEALNISIVDHPPKVGGRFSALSVVGLLPAMIVGIDPVEVREGAAQIFDRLLSLSDVSIFAPAIGAGLSYEMAQKGKTITVLMPYVDRLSSFVFWYRQLWSESIGKSGQGTTPMNALGTIDQHSQLQLYLDGPKDKLYTLLVSSMEGCGESLHQKFHHICPDIDFLYSATMGDLMEAEQRATIETLIQHQRPTRVLEIPIITPHFMGMIMMHFMLETVFMADLCGVSPFTQPAVEEGKHLAKTYLGKVIKGRSVS